MKFKNSKEIRSQAIGIYARACLKMKLVQRLSASSVREGLLNLNALIVDFIFANIVGEIYIKK